MTVHQVIADGPDRGAGLLLQQAQPEIYRSNAFRITRLRVDATSREIQRLVDKAKMMEKLGVASEPDPGRLALDPPPDLNAVRDARRRLFDPERRLIEELFWFWPRRFGDGGEDRALEALARGEVQQATTLWIGQENARLDGAVALHNLAVLAHASVLDLEHKGQTDTLTLHELTLRHSLWPQAFGRWNALVYRDDFWERLQGRIQSLDDPRLTLNTAERFRRSLPLALLLINARLAARSIQAGEVTDAERHVRLIRESGFEERWMDEAFHRASEAPRESIKVICKSAEEEAIAKPASADRVARQMIEQTSPHLATVDLLLPEDDTLHQGVHDEVALRARACHVVYGNETDDWKTSLEILEKAREIVAGDAARARLDESIRIVRSNLDHEAEHGVCFFCSQLPPDEGAAAEVKLHGDVVRLPIPGGTQIRWRHVTVKVPRCVSCQEAQTKLAGLTGVGTLLGGLAGLGSCLAMDFPGGEVACGGFVLLVVLGLLGAGLGWVVGKIVTKKGVRPESTAVQFPPIQRLLAEGWAVGEKPSDAQ